MEMSDYHYFSKRLDGTTLYRVIDTKDLVTEVVEGHQIIPLFSDKFINSKFACEGDRVTELWEEGHDYETVSYGMNNLQGYTDYDEGFKFPIKDGWIAYSVESSEGESFIFNLRGRTCRFVLVTLPDSLYIKFGNKIIDCFEHNPEYDWADYNFGIRDMTYEDNILTVSIESYIGIGIDILLNYKTGKITYKYEDSSDYTYDEYINILNGQLQDIRDSIKELQDKGRIVLKEEDCNYTSWACGKFVVFCASINETDKNYIKEIFIRWCNEKKFDTLDYLNYLLTGMQDISVSKDIKTFCTKQLFLM